MAPYSGLEFHLGGVALRVAVLIVPSFHRNPDKALTGIATQSRMKNLC